MSARGAGQGGLVDGYRIGGCDDPHIREHRFLFPADAVALLGHIEEKSRTGEGPHLGGKALKILAR
ncbi:MAG: hypothetical protein ACLFRY_12800 [Spirochaetia bacterium]